MSWSSHLSAFFKESDECTDHSKSHRLLLFPWPSPSQKKVYILSFYTSSGKWTIKIDENLTKIVTSLATSTVCVSFASINKSLPFSISFVTKERCFSPMMRVSKSHKGTSVPEMKHPHGISVLRMRYPRAPQS